MPERALVETGTVVEEAWRRLARAAEDRADPMRLVTLATLGADGGPSARLMIVRGVDAARRLVYFHTDRRSAKVAEIGVAGAACVVAYDPRDGVEVRLNGTARTHVSGSLVERVWEQTSVALRYLYAHPDAPGTPTQRDPRMTAPEEELSGLLKRRARLNFAVIEFEARELDWLQALAGAQRRVRARAERGWRPEEVRP